MQNVLASPTSVVQPAGHLNATNAHTLQQQLTDAIAEGQSPAILVDLSQVESLDSTALMAFVFALTFAQQSNKRFSLCGVSPTLRIIFELTQLDAVFEIFESTSAFKTAVA